MSELKPNPLPLSTPFPPSPRRAPLGTVAKPLPIIIDCDPGHDDAMALAVAFARPELWMAPSSQRRLAWNTLRALWI
ncbi:MAG: hypothetical protein EBX81_00120 [bacterium]|nr:hypothetical protein [Candidatus Aquidulcis sp.]